MRSVSLVLYMITTVGAIAQTPWLHVFRNDDTYGRWRGDEVVEMTVEDGNLVISRQAGVVRESLDNVSHFKICDEIPSVDIVTDEYVYEITDKENYMPAHISIDGNGVYDDVYATAVNIRGRGNTTWGYEKKPYRLKFDKKISLCGMDKAKSYVLLANYIDPTSMRNALAMKMAELIGVRYANRMIPVDVTLNGRYLGLYNLTEKVGMNAGSVDIDEDNSVLWELDTYFDEEYRFMSPWYNLPVMVKDPDMTSEEQFEYWKQDFIEFERSVKEGNAAKVLDMEQAVRVFMVFNMCFNQEFMYPKSFYMYKEIPEGLDGGDVKYSFGPVWDFDWCFGYNGVNHTSLLSAGDLLNDMDGKAGGYFFKDICSDPEFVELYSREWDRFRNVLFDEWMNYFDDYADMVEGACVRNGAVWTDAKDFRNSVEMLRGFIQARAEAIDASPTYLLYP